MENKQASSLIWLKGNPDFGINFRTTKDSNRILKLNFYKIEIIQLEFNLHSRHQLSLYISCQIFDKTFKIFLVFQEVELRNPASLKDILTVVHVLEVFFVLVNRAPCTIILICIFWFGSCSWSLSSCLIQLFKHLERHLPASSENEL